ncbi:MAG: TonB-dependent receptor family protein [Bacteroidetes bacterium]|nr:TonB-dependent receptor family protein [Bacteroidota bacterium]
MKIKKTQIILLVFILILQANTFAKENGKVTGIIINNEDNKPLISATVVLHKAKDSTIAGGAITDKSGKFTISAADGQYYIQIKYVGYENHFISDINLASNKVQRLDTIKMQVSDILQEGITVEAEKELVEIGIDSRKYNITKDITAGESNILDVLRKIPSLEVDMDDNVKMNGMRPKILIDGRESPMAEKDMLKVLSSELVESVELITNPSAKYESEGVSGIIDIKLKKEIDRGFNAMISAGYGSDFEFKYNKNNNVGVNANFKLGKLNIFARANYSKYDGYSDWSGLRKTWLDTTDINNFDTTYNNRYGDREYNSRWNNGSIGLDYEITKKDAMTFTLNYNGGNGSNNSFSKYDITNSNMLIQDYENTSNSKSNNFNGSASLYYKKEFEEKGHNLYVDAYYNNGGNSSDNFDDYYYYPAGDIDTLYMRLFNNDNDNSNNSFTFKVDYEKTLEMFGNLGAGIRTNNRTLSNITNSNQYSYMLDDYELNKLLSDDIEYDNGVYSAYFTLGKKWSSFSYRCGLRAEYTDWDFISNAADTTFGQDYLSWMPSVNLRYMIGVKHTFGVGYSRRLSRPWYNQFNPYMRIYDSTSVSVGNPDLQPSYYNSYSANYMLFTPKTTINTSFNFNNTDNSSESYNTITEWGGILTYPINAGINQRFGANLSVQQQITEWWSLNASAGLSHSKMAAPSLGIATREHTSWSANANTYISVLKKLRLSSFFWYSPSSLNLQGSSSAFYQLGAGASYSMLEDKLSLRANFSNLIAPKNNEYITFGDYFYSHSYNSSWGRRGFSLGISYKINDYKESMKRRDEDGGGGSQGGDSGGGRV